MAHESICSYNKCWPCKCKDTCKYRHLKTENKNCEIEKWSNLHSRDCRSFLQFGRCKFSDYCSFNQLILNKKEGKNIEALEKNFESFKDIIRSTPENS